MKRITSELEQIDLKVLLGILAVTETIHNLEEAIWLPAFSGRLTFAHPSVGEAEFRIAIVLLTLTLYGMMYYCAVNDNRFSSYLFSGVVVTILVNVFVPHLVGTIVTGELVPGVVSGVLLNLPITTLLLWKGLIGKKVSGRTIIIGGMVFGLLTVPVLLLSFAVGGLLKQMVL